jgi:hypothetical protein
MDAARAAAPWQALLDALSAPLALLAALGLILAVNKAWRTFACANAGSIPSLLEGADYLARGTAPADFAADLGAVPHVAGGRSC